MLQNRNQDALQARDPLIQCIGELARRYGVAFSPLLFDSLARDATGRLPFHQVEAAVELAGLDFDREDFKKLPIRDGVYPALVTMQDGSVAVVQEAREGELLLWTPGDGEARWLARDEVQAEYAGQFLSVYGDPDSLREQEAPWHKKARHHWFWGELRKERKAFRAVLVASLIINLLALALPLFSMNVYDRVIPNRAVSTLWVLGVGVLLAFAMEFALRTARTNVIDEIGRRLDIKLSQKLFGRVMGLPLAARQGSTGALASRVSEYATVRDFFASTTIVLIVDMTFLVLFVGVIAYIAGWLALVPIVAMALMATAGFFLQRKVSDAARDAQSDHGLQQTLLVESVAGMETLKSMTGERAMMGRWYNLADIGSHSQQRLKKINSVAVGLAQTFQQVSSISLIVGGYYLFDAGIITMGAIIAIVMLSSRSLAPAGQIAFLLTRARQARETLESLDNLFEVPDERKQGASMQPATVRNATLKLEDVRFAYPEAPVAALDGINLTINPGERICLIGRVASGKSTLGRLICGLYQPTEGAFLVNGVDSRQFRPQDLRSQFRFVGQDATLFTGSIKDNLALGAPEVDDERLFEAMRMSGADEFLARDDSGYDRAVGEQGRRLSGGQRSFLALARAFVTPSELLFFDEPTGAMDSQTERQFVDRVKKSLKPGQTLLISTHRPALFELCERIIVLDKGRVVADGSKEEILKRAAGQGGMGQST
ncbi:type I secretion system permease/ATPase [Altererythrobacter ishigakiensis]|uniref:ATP-binding cassette subfamily C protein LapB n=1 Tax=Altererythrobacter ishigakiensis TaxID=476157 RepID=A0A562UXK7_9SPHN|nr:type I secretion system permease/ATPase [Altererythrobacter ishigakiensis]TWJ10394.1 ATP-binding cassette subfamily C protein LapB [Altererythrobacter ishigakiensis]